MPPTRRDLFLSGFGGLALADLIRAGESHHPARAKRVIHVALNGGMSQADTFDRKPELERRHGQTDALGLTATATGTPGPLMKSPFPWKRHGACGRWVSGVFPRLAGRVDEMAFLMAVASASNVHGPASYFQSTGFALPGFPCAGAWVSYALGRLTDDLPAFVVLPDARGLPYNGAGNFSAGFLPATHQGTVIRPGSSGPAVPDLAPPASAAFATPAAGDAGLALLQGMNRRYADERPGDSRLAARVEGYELAARMQLAAPAAFDLSRETAERHTAYGTDRPGADGAFARNCLLARRLAERGVRFVQLWSGAGGATNNWDNHGSIPDELPPVARQIDQPLAALLDDLKATGLGRDTLLMVTSEFGRMPFTQGKAGRDHNGGTSVAWLAGAGVRGGAAHGASDDFSLKAAEGKTTAHDLYATALHLLGVDHERLTVRHNGTDRRLTDVHGRVVTEVLA